MKLSDLKSGDKIKWDQVIGLNDIEYGMGLILEITKDSITAQGSKRDPTKILTKDLISGRAKISLIAKGEEEAVANPIDKELLAIWEEKKTINWVAKRKKVTWAQAKELLVKAGIMNSLGQLLSEQTPSPNPAQAVNQEPDQGKQESKASIAEEKEVVKETSDPNTIIAEAKAKVEEQFKTAAWQEKLKSLVPPTPPPFSWETAWPIAQKLLDEGILTQHEIADHIGATYDSLKHKIARRRPKPEKQADPNIIFDDLIIKWVKDVMGSGLPNAAKKDLIYVVSDLEYPRV